MFMPNSLSELHTLHAWEDNQITERCTQGEYAGKVLQFKLVDKDGAIDLTNCLVQYAVTRPDKTEDLLDCIVDNGVVKCNLTYSVTSISGLVHGEVRVIGSNDSGIIKFYGVNLRVYKGVSDEAAEQSDEFTALIAALQKVVSITPDPDSENTYVVRLDDSIVQNGLNPVASGVIYDYLNGNFYTKTQTDDKFQTIKSNTYTFDTTTTNVVYSADNPKTIYTNAYVNGKNAFVLTTANNYYQIALCYDGSEYTRQLTSGGSTTYNPWLIVKNESLSNKQSSITAVNKASTTLYPSIKAVVDYLAANYENLSNKLSSEAGIDEDSTDTEYPTAKAVFDFGVQIVDDFNENITETNSNLSDLKAYIGYTSGDILGLHADFENMQFTRLGAAVGLTAGQDFDAFPMYGQRRRVVVDSNGTITQAPPEHITSGNISYDIMVYQPKFYYKVVPLKLEKQSSGLGYHIRKANYYISSTPHVGFKLHPLFFDKNGNEIEYVLFSAYEASYLYPTEGGFDYFHDGAGSDTGASLDLEYGVLKSMPNVKPISGQYKAFNKTNAEILAQNKSSNWHLDTIQSVSANQLLIAIEYGTFNTQSAIGLGIVNNSDSNSNNCSSLTGSTSAETFNTASGMASETIYDVAGTETPFNTNGKVAVSYRGMENPWGNIWKQINGINVWGNGSIGGGQLYISDNFNFNEEVKDETTINNVHYKYSSAGFSLANANGWISAFGYGKEEYDWLFLPSETTGNSSVPVSDNYYGIPNLNNSYRVLRYGGRWSDGYLTGGFCCSCGSPTGGYNSDAGGRLLFVPTATV